MGGEPESIRPGKFIAADPEGRYLIVQVVETDKSHLFQVLLNGDCEHEIQLNGPFDLNPISGINSQAIREGRLLVSLTSEDSWFFAPGVIDLTTGHMKRIRLDYLGDFYYLAWTADGQVTAAAFGLRSTLWKFRPQSRKD